MAVIPIFDSTTFDAYGRTMYIYIIDSDSTISDLPTATDPKNMHCAIAGELAIDSEFNRYIFFKEEGWKMIE